jgi:hypothetical protein
MEQDCNALQRAASNSCQPDVPILSVTPTGEFRTPAGSATLMGNRGILHSPTGRVYLDWEHEHWISCQLPAHGPVRSGSRRRYTRLLFTDEAVALAAGHRPCSRCRPAAYYRFRHAWKLVAGSTTRKPWFDVIDRTLHRYRTRSLKNRGLSRRAAELPNNTFVLLPGAAEPHLLVERCLYAWNSQGYEFRRQIDQDQLLTTVTPAPIVRVLLAGYRLDPPPLLPRPKAPLSYARER